MTIKIEIPNEQLFEKILWFLNRFKSDGVKITTLNNDEPIVPKKSKVLESLDPHNLKPTPTPQYI